MGAEAGDTESKMEEKKKENNCWNEGKLMEQKNKEHKGENHDALKENRSL